MAAQIENYRVQAMRDPFGIDDTPQVLDNPPQHPLDTPESEKLHQRLMEWYTSERTKQALNRYQMALDEDFYDGLQWSQEDIDELNERGQAAMVFNLVKPACDWVIGTAKRSPVDWRILPRSGDDVKAAGVKTDVMKYLADVNMSPYHRGRAFADAVKVGVGWLETGVRGDPVDEPIYDRYESWRNVLYDSSAVERDLDDGRYMFRWKWVDLDLSLALFPDRAHLLERAAMSTTNLLTGGYDEQSEEFWYLGQVLGATDYAGVPYGRRTYIAETSYVNYRRQRVRLIEAWFRLPVRRQVMRGQGEFNGEFDPQNEAHVWAQQQGICSVYDAVQMEMRCAVMLEHGLLWQGPSPYKHEKFPFTPIWCYRRGRDNAPYGVVRQIRDPQEDYNKRASKALFILSSRQTVMEENAVADLDEFRQEVARPDGIIIKRRGAELDIHSDLQLAEEHVMLMDRDHQHIQSTSGVTDENLGRQTNAVSGEAIKARQLQGSVVTAEIFENLRYATQLHGQKRLSLAEQFIAEPRVIRLTGAKGQINWTQINQPVQQPDGTVVFQNDITASQADFIVSEQDFHYTMRQALLQELLEWTGRLPPEMGAKLVPPILELLDIPDKDEFVRDIREALGSPTPREDATPEELAEIQAKQQEAQERADMEKRAAIADVAEKEQTANLKAAQAAKAMAEAEQASAMQEQTAQMLAQQIAQLRMMLEQIGPMAGQAQPQAPQAAPAEMMAGMPAGGAMAPDAFNQSEGML